MIVATEERFQASNTMLSAHTCQFRNPKVVFVPYDKAYEEGFEDMPRRIPDISKVNKLVGFKPAMELDGS